MNNLRLMLSANNKSSFKCLQSTAVSVTARLYSSRPQAGVKNVVVVDGARIPFALAGTVYSNYLAVDLGDVIHRCID